MKREDELEQELSSIYNQLVELYEEGNVDLIEKRTPDIRKSYRKLSEDLYVFYGIGDRATELDFDMNAIKRPKGFFKLKKIVTNIDNIIKSIKSEYFFDARREMRIMFPNGMADPDDNEGWFDDEDL